MSKEKINIIIAETYPVISSGFSACLKKMNTLHCTVEEAPSYNALLKRVHEHRFDLAIINPVFGGVFDPKSFREESLNPKIKLAAIETGKLNRQTAQLYDVVISIFDDMDSLYRKINDLFVGEHKEMEEKENLSQREKEIISLVVKGLTNQEIADKLFLSVHTIITHRRNIARKLEIHSATGLTIYAIVNKIVDISDIKL